MRAPGRCHGGGWWVGDVDGGTKLRLRRWSKGRADEGKSTSKLKGWVAG